MNELDHSDRALLAAMLDAPPFVVLPSAERVPGYDRTGRTASYRTADVFGRLHVWHWERATVGDAYGRDDGQYYVHGWTYWQAMGPGPLFAGPVDSIEACTLHELVGSRSRPTHGYGPPNQFNRLWHHYVRRQLGYDDEGWRPLPDVPDAQPGSVVRADHGHDRWQHEDGARVYRQGAGWGWMSRSGLGSHIFGTLAPTLAEAKALATQ